MKKLLLAAVATIGLAGAANAVPIAAGSLLSLNGTDSFTANSVTFIGPANIGFGTGSFAGLACTACATFNSFSTGTPTPFTLYTATQGAISTSLTATATPNVTFSPGPPLANLTVTGSGTLTLTGFDPTPGQYILTTQGPTGVEVTFSVTSVGSAVPEPASIALLGVGLLGLSVVARRRTR